MKHKVSELTAALLDAAVAKAEGRNIAEPVYSAHSDSERDWSPSTEWADGGPIIERERRFCLQAPDALEEQLGRGSWGAIVLGGGTGWSHGPTALIAAMRAYVASKLGEEIEL